MRFWGSFRRREAAGAAGAALSSGRHCVHPLHVPRRGDEAPLALDVVKAAQKELAEAHYRFDDPEHRFRGLLAQRIETLASNPPPAAGMIRDASSVRLI